MAFSNITQLALGNTVTIAFSEGIRQNLSLDYPEWEMVKSIKTDAGGERSHQYIMQTSLGPSSVQYRNPGQSGYEFPGAQQTSQQEAVAVFKELATTISFDYNLYERLMNTKNKYDADRLKTEIESKNVATRRQMCIDFYGNGSGALGQVGATVVVNADGSSTISLLNSAASTGFAGNFSIGERVIAASAAAVASAPTVTGGTYAYLEVVARDPRVTTNTVTVRAFSATGAALVITAWAPASGTLLYKAGQPTIPNLTTVSDWGTVSEAMVGLGSLIANDGRTVHGVQMAGALAASVYDNNGAALDSSSFEEAMNQVKNAVGQGRFKWSKALMNRSSRSAMIDSRETDRRFISATDGTRGVAKIQYVHEQDNIELQGAEFCPFNSIYILPEGKVAGHKVLEYHGSDFKAVQDTAGVPFFLLQGATSHTTAMRMYLFGYGVLTNNYPAACVAIRNFTV